MNSGMTLATLVKALIGLMNAFIPVLVGAGILFFFFGLIKYIYNAGDAKGRENGRVSIIWGLTGLFVIFSLWGILKFIQAAFTS